MTTNRTTVRRWLAIGGTAHRPPRRARKTRHRSIVAPLTAALGATAAVGVGLALARIGSGQLDERRRRQRDARAIPGELPPNEGLRQLALAQAELALAELEKAADDPARAVHETRKAIKRICTVLSLLDSELGHKRCVLEQDSLRQAAAGLAGSRDAEVLIETLDRLLARHPRRLGAGKGPRRMRRTLLAKREQAELEVIRDAGALAAVTAELRSFRARAAGWPLSAGSGTTSAEAGLEGIYRQGRRRRRRAKKAGKKHRTEAMHRWRKRVKELRYAAEMLDRIGPSSMRLAKLAKRADRLGEVLGEDHDLAMLAEWVQRSGKSSGAKRPTRRRLLKLIGTRRRKLARRAFQEGARIYRRPSAEFRLRVRGAR
jgi:CHAD domain-containing protein